MPDLLAIAQNDPDQASKILALQGYIRMAGQTGDTAHKVQAYHAAAALVSRADEKRLLLAGLAEVSSVECLKMVEPYLDDAALHQEAYLAYTRIAESLGPPDAAAAREALKRVVEQSRDGGLRDRARQAAERIK